MNNNMYYIYFLSGFILIYSVLWDFVGIFVISILSIFFIVVSALNSDTTLLYCTLLNMWSLVSWRGLWAFKDSFIEVDEETFSLYIERSRNFEVKSSTSFRCLSRIVALSNSSTHISSGLFPSAIDIMLWNSALLITTLDFVSASEIKNYIYFRKNTCKKRDIKY